MTVLDDQELRDALAGAGCSIQQIMRLVDLAARIESIPWGKASTATSDDEWGVLAFLEQLQTPDGLAAKSAIVADYSGASRWDTLGMLLTAESPWALTQLPDELLGIVTEMMESLVMGDMVKGVGVRHRPSLLRFWRLPKQLRLLKRIGPIVGMTSTCVQGMTIRTLIPDGFIDIVGLNPYEPLFQVFERGILVDWINWRFTNLRFENLGPLPEPML